jgi:uncharacterized protein (TIGR02444 family)
MSSDRANDFWDFSLRVYRQPGVADACIRLQDRCKADVNLLLYLCWLGQQQAQPLDAAEVDAIVRETADWREGVVRPLRAVRRRMKEAFRIVPPELSEPLRSDIKRAELESERLQQVVLFRRTADEPAAIRAPEDAARIAQENLETYFQVIGVTLENAQRIDCETMVTAAYPRH